MSSKNSLPQPNYVVSPQKWSRTKRLHHFLVPCAAGFLTPFASSSYIPSTEQIQQTYKVSQIVALLPYSVFVLGTVVGTILAGPLSKQLGRRPLYILDFVLLGSFTLLAGFSQSLTTLLICRFFAGFFGTPGFNIGAASVADLYSPEERLIPVTTVALIIFMATPIDTLCGSYITAYASWRWTQWIIPIAAAISMPLTIDVEETYQPKRLQSPSPKTGSKNGSPSRVPLTDSDEKDTSHEQHILLSSSERFSIALIPPLQDTLLRPVRMILNEAVITYFCLYIGFTFSVTYLFLPGIPYVFSTKYQFSKANSGLPLVAVIVGYILSSIFYVALRKHMTKRAQVSAYLERKQELKEFEKRNENDALLSQPKPCTPQPELKLIAALICSPMIPVGLFGFGWTTGRTHWIYPCIAVTVFAFGSFSICTASNLYLLHAYGPKYGASATAATRLVGTTLSLIFPLIIVPLFKGIGVGWTMSFFGLLSVLLMPGIWTIYLRGEEFRKRSLYPSQK